MNSTAPNGSSGRATKNAVIAGGSGFIGQHLARALRADGYRVSIIGRSNADAHWGSTAVITDLLEGADVLVNLAGQSVNCRYNDSNRAEIMRSRTETTRELALAIQDCEAPPTIWVNASTTTIYRAADDRAMTESAGDLGTGFSVDVATNWEHELFGPELPHTRRVAIRLPIVFGDGPALNTLVKLTRVGLGGPQFDGRWFASEHRRKNGTFHEFGTRGGRQKFSWVHIDDVVSSIRFLIDNPNLDGPVNVSAPEVVDNRTLMRTLRRVLRVPFGLPAFRWMLELGSIALRTESELVLKSRWVAPERLLQAGYDFKFSQLEPALRNIISDQSGSTMSGTDGSAPVPR